MKASHILRALCAITVAFLLISAIPLASGQAPEAPRQERLEGLKDPGASRYPGVMPQAQSAVSPQSPEDLGAWSKITYVTYSEADGEIYTMNGDLTNLVRVTTNTIDEWYPELDRGCVRIVYSRDDGDPEVYKMNAIGTSQTRLTDNTTNDFAPTWSPDRTKIAYYTNAGGDDEIYRMTDSGASKTNLTNNSVDDWGPVWSPDGLRIAFASFRNSQNRIWVMNQDGSGQVQLNSTTNSYELAWSPDGTQIAYDADNNSDGWTELWLMNSDGSNQHMIYDPPESQTDAYVRSWSPDGRYIAFNRVSWTYDDPDWYWTTAYLDAYDTTSGTPIRLSTNTEAWNPAWQTCDNTAPTSSVAALPTWSPATFTANWSGTDTGGSELKNYDVQVRDGGGVWTDWQLATTATSASYSGLHMHTYYFRSRAIRHSTWKLTR